jgi:hypothetical protein
MSIHRAEVIEVFNDLSVLTPDKIDSLLGRIAEPPYLPRMVSPEESIRNMPRDSIRARLHGDEFSFICYPFFPSHLRLPVKVGEEIWVLFEGYTSLSPTLHDPENTTSGVGIKDVVMSARNLSTTPSENQSVGYWMCRPTSERQIEDLNYTAFGRVKHSSGFSMQTAADMQRSSQRSSRSAGFPSFSETSRSAERVEKDDKNLESRIRDFLPRFNLEPVSRYTRQPGETVIAGSNDARIVLGQTRAGRPGATSADSGSVDIVAGTGKSSTAPNVVGNGLGTEVDKDPGLTGKSDVVSEGDPNFSEDMSRILVTENIEVDSSFSLNVSQITSSDTSSKTGPSIAAKSQHIRIISTDEGSIRIIVEGPTQSSITVDASGNIDVKAENVAIGSVSSPQITVSAGSDTARVHAGKVFLGTSDTPSNTSSNQAFGVLVSPKVYSIIAGLALDLGALAGAPTPQGVLFPQTYANLTRLIAEAGTDAITLGLFSKTVFVSK